MQTKDPTHTIFPLENSLPPGTSFCCAHLCKWIMRKANVSLLAWGSSPTAWYMAAMLLSSSVISVNEQKAPRGLDLFPLTAGFQGY